MVTRIQMESLNEFSLFQLLLYSFWEDFFAVSLIPYLWTMDDRMSSLIEKEIPGYLIFWKYFE